MGPAKELPYCLDTPVTWKIYIGYEDEDLSIYLSIVAVAEAFDRCEARGRLVWKRPEKVCISSFSSRPDFCSIVEQKCFLFYLIYSFFFFFRF